jgi:hypothetical protein
MANEQWFVLKIRLGFATVVTQRLRKFSFEVVVPETKTIDSQELLVTPDYLYCRFGLENRQTVTTIPGVLDILGTPEPMPIDGDWSAVHAVTPFRL